VCRVGFVYFFSLAVNLDCVQKNDMRNTPFDSFNLFLIIISHNIITGHYSLLQAADSPCSLTSNNG
jgi:hypothetical protein